MMTKYTSINIYIYSRQCNSSSHLKFNQYMEIKQQQVSTYIVILHTYLTKYSEEFAKWYLFSLRLRPANVLTQIPSVAKHVCNPYQDGKKNVCPHNPNFAVKWRRKNWNNCFAPHTRLILVCHGRLTIRRHVHRPMKVLVRVMPIQIQTHMKHSLKFEHIKCVNSIQKQGVAALRRASVLIIQS